MDTFFGPYIRRRHGLVNVYLQKVVIEAVSFKSAVETNPILDG
jgi:hypothetical protein